MNDQQIKEIMALVDELSAALARETIPECRGGYAKAREAIESALRAAVPEVPEVHFGKTMKPEPVASDREAFEAWALEYHEQRPIWTGTRYQGEVWGDLWLAFLAGRAPQSEQVRGPLSVPTTSKKTLDKQEK